MKHTRAPVTITAAVIADAPAIQRLLRDTWHDTYDALIGRAKVDDITTRWHAVPVLERQIGDAGNTFLVARQEGVVVGHALAHRDGRTIVLERLYVLPAAQRRGVGTGLIEALTARFGEARRMSVAVARDNAKGVAFYLGRGFIPGESFDEDGIPHLGMEMVLPTGQP